MHLEENHNGGPQVIVASNASEKTQVRAKWGNSLEFLMSCISMSIGLGNIWRFPFTAYENGGGAFLIPYLIVLVLIGRPMYYMDMSLGQFSSKSSVKVFKHLKPAFKGIGFVQVFVSGCIATYYCSLIAIILIYLFSSFKTELPWTKCKTEWSTEGVCKMPGSNSSKAISLSELFFTREVLKEQTLIENGIGLPDWRLILCLAIGWLCSFLVSVKSIRSSGKASYFLAIFPYVIMVIFLIRAVTLNGCLTGIIYFITPDWGQIFTVKIWYHAVTQCFFSLNVGSGAIIMYASFNDFSHNINRDAIIITTLDTFTSLLAGVTTFGILGNLAYELNIDIEDVIKSGGTGLVFISYPEALSKFEYVPWLFSILFFLMLFVLGVGSLVALHNCVNTGILDSFPNLKSWQVAAGTSIVGFLIGLVYVTPAGQIIVTVMDFYAGTFIVFMVGVFETVGVMWCYGVASYCIDVEHMLKQKTAVFWRIIWGIVTPTMLVTIFIYFLATLPRLTYGRYPIPDMVLIGGWFLPGIAATIVIFYLVKAMVPYDTYELKQNIIRALSSDKWGPHNEDEKQSWNEFKKQEVNRLSVYGKTWVRRKLNFFLGR